MLSDHDLQQVYLQYKAEITRYLARFVSNAEDAEDMAQECFIRLMKASIMIAEDKIFPYLRRTARNMAIDAFRKQSRVGRQAVKAEIVAFHRDTSDMEMKESIEEIVSLVKNRDHRQILELRLIHGYTVKETAALVNKSEGLVRTSLFHAMKRIRTDLIS